MIYVFNKEGYPLRKTIVPAFISMLLIVLFKWLIIPLFKTGSNYAYFFIDANKLGWGKVLLDVLFLSLFFLFLGYCVKVVKILKGYTKKCDNLKSSKK